MRMYSSTVLVYAALQIATNLKKLSCCFVNEKKWRKQEDIFGNKYKYTSENIKSVFSNKKIADKAK